MIKSPFPPQLNEELGFSFATLDGSWEVWAMGKVFDNSVNLATAQLTGPQQNIIQNCHNHLSFSLSPNQQNSGQDFLSPHLALFITIFHTMLEPNGCKDSFFLESINIDRISTSFWDMNVKCI